MAKKIKPRTQGTLEMNDSKLAILLFIEKYYRETGLSPAVLEICRATGHPSTGLVFFYMEQLVAQGFLKKAGGPHTARRFIPTYKQRV